MLKDVPIMVYHGDLDTVVPINESMHMIESVNKKGGNAQIKILYHTGHDAWVDAYKNDELWKWFLSHKRENRNE
jgi:dipeptidyl aminopeptidase/acylaminoacyl peptidase